MTVKPVGAALVLLLGLLGIGAGVPTPTPVPGTSIAGDVLLNVTPANFGTLAEGQELILSVTIGNSGESAVSSAELSASVNPTAFRDRGAFAGWVAGAEKGIDTLVPVARASVLPIAAGQSRTIELRVPASSLGFETPGIYPVKVELTSAGQPVAESRSSVASKAGMAGPIPLAVAAPLVVPASADPLITAEDLAEYTGAEGLLTSQLDAMIGTPLAIGIDPRILVSIRVLGTAAPQSALDWLDRLAAAGNDTFALGYADTDLTAVPQTGERDVLAPDTFDFVLDEANFPLGEQTPPADPDLPTPTETGEPEEDGTPSLPDAADLLAWDYSLPAMAWPAENTVTARDMDVLSAAGYQTVILSSSNVSRPAKLPNAAGSTRRGKILVTDATLSRLFNEAVRAPTAADWEAAMTRLFSATALVSELSPGKEPTMLLTLARSWPTTGYRLEQTLVGLYSRAWVSSATVPDALASTPTVGTIADRPQSKSRIGRVERMLTAEKVVDEFATVVDDPIAMTSERRLRLLALLSSAWLSDVPAWAIASRDFLEESNEMLDSVKIAGSSDILLPTVRGAIPVTVSNSLDQPVTVYITVRSQSAVLTVEKTSVKLTIEPGSLRKAEIPVLSLANGRVELAVSLKNRLGERVGSTTFVDMNVQADWETFGTVAVVIFVIGVFGIGIFRNVRKRRRVGAPDAAAVVDE